MAYKGPTVALTEEAQPGQILDMMGFPIRILEQITREEYFSDLERRREHDRQRGKPPARAGSYNTETRQFVPTREVPAEMRYFYTVEPA